MVREIKRRRRDNIKIYMLNIICEVVDWFYPTQARYQ